MARGTEHLQGPFYTSGQKRLILSQQSTICSLTGWLSGSGFSSPQPEKPCSEDPINLRIIYWQCIKAVLVIFWHVDYL